jgi:hypothetical protein
MRLACADEKGVKGMKRRFALGAVVALMAFSAAGASADERVALRLAPVDRAAGADGRAVPGKMKVVRIKLDEIPAGEATLPFVGGKPADVREPLPRPFVGERPTADAGKRPYFGERPAGQPATDATTQQLPDAERNR